MRLLFAGDFRIGHSSGYAVILENLLVELSKRHEVTLLGITWEKKAHNYDFQVIPSTLSWVPMQALRVHQALKFDHFIVAMDVPKVQLILQHRAKQEIEGVLPPVSAIFPIEAPPVDPGWALSLRALHKSFVISQFGVRELAEVGIEAVHLPMTSVVPPSRPPLPLRKYVMYGDGRLLNGRRGEGMKIALTVADNQERKSLPVIAKAVKRVPDLYWVLVTPIFSPHGWTLAPLWERLEVADRVVMLNSDLPGEVLSGLYARADCFVLASQAEGACLPLYEAMAHGLPCVAPRHTAITEALEDGRGVLVEPQWSYITPWGNVERCMVSPSSLADGITKVLAHDDPTALTEWIEKRTWEETARILEEELDEAKKEAATPSGLTPVEAGDDAGGSAGSGDGLLGGVVDAGDVNVGGGVRLRPGTADPIREELQSEVG